MDETKKPWASKAMWSGVVALGALSFATKVQITSADQATLTDIITTLIEYGGILFAMYGRYSAKKTISMQ